MTLLLDTGLALRQLINAQRQNKRLLRLTFPRNDAPAGALLVANRLDADERLSRDFRFTVQVLSDNPDIALKDLMGKMVTVELARGDGSTRYFNGYAFDFRFIKNDGGFSYYALLLLPWLAFLRYRRDNYLFHGKTVEQQTAEILSDYAVSDWKIATLRNDAPMTDACQFDETDYNYLHRRWEAKGWHYHYEHRRDGHTLVLGDDSTRAAPIDGGEPILWQGSAHPTERGLWTFSRARGVSSTTYAASSFDFKRPQSPVQANVPTLNQQGRLPELEVFEYAGAYGYPTTSAGEDFVRLRMEEIEAAAKYFEAGGDDDRLQCGRAFVLRGHQGLEALGNEPGDHEFLILDASHAASNNYDAGEGSAAEYRSSITCIRKKIPWRPGRGFNSTEPALHGLQTALVVGPKGEEIHTDEYGRVRVQFHWDREGGYDEKSSAWVRVANTWAGSNFGFMAIPRIGQEVIVQWLDGNPDRPLITGRVYNQGNMPPWELPANKTQTGMLSRSSPGGGYGNANALRFEDLKGKEEIWLHAEKDQRIEVEHDESHWVGNDRSKTIDHDETVHVKHDRTETVDNNETITVHNHRSERVDHNETISIGDNRTEEVGQNEIISIGANQAVTIGQNKAETVAIAKALSIGAGYAVTVGGAMNTAVGLAQFEEVGLSKTTIVGKKYTIDAGDELSITVGKSSLVMRSDGTVLINGTEFNFSASGPVQISGKDVDIN